MADSCLWLARLSIVVDDTVQTHMLPNRIRKGQIRTLDKAATEDQDDRDRPFQKT